MSSETARALALVETGDSADLPEANVHAQIAIATALERIGDILERLEERGNFNQREF